MLWESSAASSALRAPREMLQQKPAPAAREGHFHSHCFCTELPGCVRHIQLSSGMRERLSVEFFPFFFFFKDELTKLQVAVWQSRFSPRLLTPTASDSALSRLPASLFSSCHSNVLSLRWLKQILPRGRARRAAQAGQHGSLLWSWHRAGICRIPFLNRGGCRVSLGKEFLLPLLVLFPGKAPRAKPTPGDPRSCTFAKQCLIPHLTFQLYLLQTF